MPDKEGADDEKKSTKSVVNKKQKQMMGEEGYDIARDMGKVKPSKDKKDATTMPVSDEVKKTQKVNKGPSAFERVKAKYGKSVMKVEQLDLTKVAEAFGGYIVEKNDKEENKKKAEDVLKKAVSKVKTQSPEQAARDAAFKDMRTDSDERFSNVTQDVRKGLKDAVKGQYKEPTGRGQVTVDPKKGEVAKSRKILQKFIDTQKKTRSVDQPLVKPASPSFVDPRRDPFQDDEGMGAPQGQTFKPQKDEKTQRKEAQARIADLTKSIRSGVTKSGEQVIDVLTEPKRRRATRYKGKFTPDERVARVKAQIDKKSPTYTSPITGGKLPKKDPKDPSGAYQRRLERAYFSKNPQGVIGGPSVLPAGEGEKGEEQKDREQKQQQQQQQQQNKSYKDFQKDLKDTTEFINKKTGERFDMNDPEQKNEYLRQQGKKFRTKKQKEDPRGGSGGEKSSSGGGNLSRKGGSLATTGGSLAKPVQQKEPSLVSKSIDFAKKNPATAFLTLDAIRKFLPSRSPFGVVGGRAGTRSAAR